MLRFGKWVLFALVLVAIASALWEPLFAERVTPPPVRKYDARIVRDEYGVPHLFGKTDADAAYALAYAHAEDDFPTIEEVVAMTRGRDGALMGADGAKVDYVFHLLGARETAERDYPGLPADVRAVLEGYAAGLNHYAETHPGEVRLRNLFPVNGVDIATGFVLRSPFFFGLDNVIGALAADEPPPVESAPPMTPAGRDPGMNGSNAFAVSPKRMADGHTWLISNSHQPYEGNVAWYEAVMHSGEGLDMAGALFPGSPFVLLGHNRNLGWTNTVNHPDLIDVYKLVLNEAGDKYRYDGEWKPIEKRRIWLAVRFGPFTLPVPKTVYRALQGPVIVNKSGAYAIRYAGIGESRMLEQYYRITKARDWTEWTRAMSLGGIPATNFVYADRTGRIAYIYNALFPPRKPGFDYTKVIPGDTSKYMWTGSLGFEAMPKLIDPPSGFVTNANNTPFLSAGPGSELKPESFSPLLGIERRLTNRGIRAVELLSADSSVTPEELLRIKFDTRYSQKSYVKPWIDALLAVKTDNDPELAKAQALLRSWDYSSDGVGGADALAEVLIRAAARANYNGTAMPDAREELKKASDWLTKFYGRLDPPLLKVQRLRRGKVDLPMDGGTDTLRATSVWDKAMAQKDGHGRVKHGDSFIMLIDWDPAGKLVSRSIQPYGAATNRPDSQHYTDQMKLFVEHRFKPVHFERSDLLMHAKRAYRVN